MLRSVQHGVTLVELIIGIAIVSVLLMMGVPTFNQWIQNSQNRTAAESILNGLQLARAEAVRRNAVVRFDLINDSGLVAWKVGCASATASCPETIQSRSAADGSVNARVGISTEAIPVPTPTDHFKTALAAGAGLSAGVSFNAMGRVPTANIGGDVVRIDITNAVRNDTRRYVVTVGTGGQIRMCDPALAFSANPQGCS